MGTAEPKLAAVENPELVVRSRTKLPSEKRAARRKAVVAQLTDPVVVAEDVGQLEQQANEIYLAFKPRNGWQEWLTSEIAVTLIRINRSARVERKMRDWASYRAIDFWEDDQKVAVETLAVDLGKDPGAVVAELRRSPTGLDWLTTRWRILARVDASQWTDPQRSLARCLVGGDPEVDLTTPGFAEAKLAELEATRGRVEEADAIARGLVEADLNDDAVPNLGRLRRYARALHRQLKWYVDQFHVDHPDRWDDPRRKPAYLGPAVEPVVASPSGKNETKPTLAAGAVAGPEVDAESGSGSACLEKNETNPPLAPGAVAIPENDKTKPFEPHQEKNETNPFERVEADQQGAGIAAQVVARQSDRGKSSSHGPDPIASRKRRVDPVRAVDRQRKAAKRRSA